MQDLMTSPSGASHPGDNVTQVPTRPVDSTARLVAAVGAWASRRHRQNATIEGFRLLNVLRIHARPIHQLRDLDTEADRLKRLVDTGDPAGRLDRYAAYVAAEKAANDAYAAAMRDVYDVFEVITGVAPDANHGLTALNLKVSLTEIAEAARTLAVTV